MRFSERHGYRPVIEYIQLECMDNDLRNGLWNTLDAYIWDRFYPNKCLLEQSSNLCYALTYAIWQDFFKWRFDDIRYKTWSDISYNIRKWYLTAQWHEVYDFIEFISQTIPNLISKGEYYIVGAFRKQCNYILEREKSAYRFIDTEIAPITDEREIQSIEEVLSSELGNKGTGIHLKRALELLSDRKNADYRNSIKESITAVEAIACAITGNNNTSLGEALKAIEKNKTVKLHGSLKAGYEKIYGYTSDGDGIRHALTDEPSLDFEDAYYMLISCSAFINYLIAKASKAGIELSNNGK